MSPAADGVSQSRRFLLDPFEPAYLEVWRSGRMAARTRAALQELEECRVCPRDCGVNRLKNETRACNTGRFAVVSSAFPHFGEEECLRGRDGSGTIFFSRCNLRCAFCQNWEISQRLDGSVCRPGEIAERMLELQARGCHNINFVTPEHVVPQVIEAIAAAVPMGLNLPIVYNTGGYDAIRSLELLEGLVDIYMPDFKFWKPETSVVLSRARDYPERAREAIAEMHRQVGPLRFGSDGFARRGLLVRYLVMPGQTEEAAAIFEWLAREVSPDTFVNIMAQYRPEHLVGRTDAGGKVRYENINRRPLPKEIENAYEAARRAGLWRLDGRRARAGAPIT
jgi:putative pyruvate formate lyase activating enzyme